ncbi:MAG: DUF4199 domain-containing protein [Gemmatimonadaceae bacterium]
MKKTVWTFGLICGAVMAAFMVATLPFANAFDEHSLIVGYAGIVAGFLLVFFGVRSYRDNVLGGTIGFGRAFSTGLLIAAIGSMCYVATWEVLYYEFMPDFYSKYAQAAVDQARKSGASDAEIVKTRTAMEAMAKSAKNPAWVAATTFVEPFPVGLVIALVSAGVLRRKRGARDAVLAPA